MGACLCLSLSLWSIKYEAVLVVYPGGSLVACIQRSNKQAVRFLLENDGREFGPALLPLDSGRVRLGEIFPSVYYLLHNITEHSCQCTNIF